MFCISKYLVDFVLAFDCLVLEVPCRFFVSIMVLLHLYKNIGLDCLDFNRNCLLHLSVFEKMENIVVFQKILVVLFTIAFFWKHIKYMWSFLSMEKEPVTVLVTGVAGMLKSILLFLPHPPCF